MSDTHEGFPINRDPLLWPFTRESVWNLPLSVSAIYTPANIQRAMNYGMTVDEDIIILTPDAPLTDVWENFKDWSEEARQGQVRCVKEGRLITQLPIPANFIRPHERNDTPNSSAAILLPDGDTVYQTQPLHRCEAGSYATSHYVFPEVSLRNSDGVPGAHGGSAMSSIGGAIRMGELVKGGVIRHALKVNLWGKRNYVCRANEPDGKSGFRWPALAADSGACQGGYGGSNPELQMGSLLALKPDFDIQTLRTEPARILARAFQDYGAYIVDDAGWDVYAVITEYGPAGRVTDAFQREWGYTMTPESKTGDWARDMDDLFLALHVVTNNTPETPGGGPLNGLRRAPLAPPFK
jgi:hypothetical protein